MSAELSERRLLVAGASSGIGAAVARAAAACGARVALLARRRDPLDALAAELTGAHGPGAAVVVPADITDDTAAGAAVDAAAEQLGGLDALVNAAGVFHAGPVGDTGPAQWRAIFDLNVVGLLVVTRAALPHLRADGIRVTTMAPGFVRTAILDEWPDGPLRERYTERMDSGGLDPEVVADAVVHVIGLPAGVGVAEYAVTTVAQ
ncbi:SDR family oxidoreductase [Pseudonocardia sp. H11422]|uniref:SDR family oxidoreductase n=1 Tax=Pseudonocardia sp. H11422 TaxID=2835866 RepID=UPI001BDC379C|nr:SDR family NAD(P)-dependent oxidoreductase [Pseudonocardia sp. H11422]